MLLQHQRALTIIWSQAVVGSVVVVVGCELLIMLCVVSYSVNKFVHQVFVALLSDKMYNVYHMTFHVNASWLFLIRMAPINSGPFFLRDDVDIVNVGKVLLDRVDLGPLQVFLIT